MFVAGEVLPESATRAASRPAARLVAGAPFVRRRPRVLAAGAAGSPGTFEEEPKLFSER